MTPEEAIEAVRKLMDASPIGGRMDLKVEVAAGFACSGQWRTIEIKISDLSGKVVDFDAYVFEDCISSEELSAFAEGFLASCSRPLGVT